MERMDDTIFWALVILGVATVILLVYYVFFRRKQSSAPDTKRADTEESVNQVLRNFGSKGDRLEVVRHRDGSEPTASDTEIAASAEKAVSQINNGQTPLKP